MREGLLWDLLGRAGGSDPRTASVDALATRYAVDRAQARRVEATALMLFDQVAAAWKLGAEANKRAGGMGLISGRKAFQRPFGDGIKLLNAIQDVYLDKTITIP